MNINTFKLKEFSGLQSSNFGIGFVWGLLKFRILITIKTSTIYFPPGPGLVT